MISVHGIYDGLSEADYHGDPFEGGSLSSTGARRLLDCPAKYWWERNNPPVFKAEFEFGHAAHAHVLGVGAPIEVLDFDDRRTKAFKEEEADARAAGRTPILRKDWEIVEAMAAPLRSHPVASQLLSGDGLAEQSLFWRDASSGLTLRARIDWLPVRTINGRKVIVDYKTARSADRRHFARALGDFGYHQQDAWYVDGVTQLGDAPDPAFLFIVQEKTAPYVVNVIELDEEAVQIGRDRNRRAIEVFAECTASGVWPGYSTRIEQASLPRYLTIQHEEEFATSW